MSNTLTPVQQNFKPAQVAYQAAECLMPMTESYADKSMSEGDGLTHQDKIQYAKAAIHATKMIVAAINAGVKSEALQHKIFHDNKLIQG